MYQLGEIFYLGDGYTERAKFCIANGYMIKEIEADEKGRRFQICEFPKPTENELIAQEIIVLKRNLEDTDYQALKYAEGALSEEEYAEMKAQRQQWRAKINELEEKLSQNA